MVKTRVLRAQAPSLTLQLVKPQRHTSSTVISAPEDGKDREETILVSCQQDASSTQVGTLGSMKPLFFGTTNKMAIMMETALWFASQSIMSLRMVKTRVLRAQ